MAFSDSMLANGPDGGFIIPEALRARRVRVQAGHPIGSIQIATRTRWLYLITDTEEAIRYPIAVGRAGREFRGRAYVGWKDDWPFWQPTANMIRREPGIYRRYAGGVPGGPDNPLGARALYLYRGNRDTLYRIHGTSQPWSIGQAGSSGCIRMFNSHIMDLYDRVSLGARVVAY